MKLNAELLHVAALFNPKINNSFKSLLPDFPWQTQIGKELFGNKEISSSLPEWNSISVQSKLSSIMIPEELEEFGNLIEQMKEIDSPTEINQITKSLFVYYQEAQVKKILDSHFDDIPAIISRIRELPTEVGSGVEVYNLGELKADEVIAEELGGVDRVFPSNFDLVKKCSPYGGYLPGQVVMWVAPPGVGKSVTMLYEVLGIAASGKKVLYVAMGDLMRYDFMCRATTLVTNEPYFKVATNLERYYSDELRELFGNIDLICVPSKKLSSEELKALVGSDYDMVVVDYDSNMKDNDASDNMYHVGGAIYEAVTELARPTEGARKETRLVFIASQPKVSYWDAERIPLEGAGESSRKQQTADMMITIGRVQVQGDVKAGYMSIVKNRRGKVDLETPVYMSESGRMIEITEKQLALMRVHSS